MNNTLKVGQSVLFANEPKAKYEVKAVSGRYAIVSRKLHRRWDAELLHREVEMCAYCTFTEAFNHLKDSPVYSIIDFEENIRGAHNMVFNCYDFNDQRSMKKLLIDLQRGKVEISHRNRTELELLITNYAS